MVLLCVYGTVGGTGYVSLVGGIVLGLGAPRVRTQVISLVCTSSSCRSKQPVAGLVNIASTVLQLSGVRICGTYVPGGSIHTLQPRLGGPKTLMRRKRYAENPVWYVYTWCMCMPENRHCHRAKVIPCLVPLAYCDVYCFNSCILILPGCYGMCVMRLLF